MAVVAVHDVRDAPLAVQAGPRADELEGALLGTIRQMKRPGEAGANRPLDDRRRFVRAEEAVEAEAFDVIGGELRRQDLHRAIGQLVQKRAADNHHETGGERERHQAGAPPAYARSR